MGYRVVGLQKSHLFATALVLALAPALAGCGSVSDFNLKDQEWFSRPKVFSRSISIEQPPLSPERSVTADQLITADGACPGLAPSNAQALADGSSEQPVAVQAGKVALGLPECEVARGIGTPDNVSLSSNEGERVAVLTYLRGSRAGIYRFVGGRLASIERSPELAPEPKQAKPKKKRVS